MHQMYLIEFFTRCDSYRQAAHPAVLNFPKPYFITPHCEHVLWKKPPPPFLGLPTFLMILEKLGEAQEGQG